MLLRGARSCQVINDKVELKNNFFYLWSLNPSHPPVIYLEYKEDTVLRPCLKTCDGNLFLGNKFRLLTEALYSLPQSTLESPADLQPHFMGAPGELWFPKYRCSFSSSVQNSIVRCPPSHLGANCLKARIKS